MAVGKGGRRLRCLLPAFLAALLCLLTATAFAADDGLQPIPPFGPRVTDLTGTLDAQQKQHLEDELAALEKSKGSRVAVLMLPTTAPEDIAQYGIRVTDAWKLSRTDGKTQDGVLLTIAKNDRRVRIDVGRDLEGAVPDAAAARIIREYITPKFRSNDYYGGIEDAVGALTKLINDEPLPPPLADDDTRHGGNLGGAIMFALFAAFWARAIFGRLPSMPRAGLVGAVAGGAGWLFSGLLPLGIGLGVFGLIFGLFGGGGGGFANRGGWGGFGGGGGWSGGGGGGWGGGGGFSGGSGGGFSGGGASGSW